MLHGHNERIILIEKCYAFSFPGDVFLLYDLPELLSEVVLHFVVKYRVLNWDTVPEFRTKVVNITISLKTTLLGASNKILFLSKLHI